MMQELLILAVVLVFSAMRRKSLLKQLPPLQPFVVCELRGGLGNQLFQIASAYSFAKEQGKELVITQTPLCGKRPSYWDSWTHKFRHFALDDTFMQQKLSRGARMYEEIGMKFRHIPKDACILRGYFQSERFFEANIDYFRKMFCLPEDKEKRIRDRYGSFFEATRGTSLVVHVRRGDYLTHIGGSLFHIGPDYYRTGIERASSLLLGGSSAKNNGSSLQLVVFSDDLEWCRSQDFFRGAVFVDEPDEVTALYLMSQFENYLMSNSSFCWWSVCLYRQAKLVLAPDPWFGKKHHQDFEDVYVRGWTRHAVPE